MKEDDCGNTEISLRTEECNVGGALRTEIVTYYKEQCIYIVCCLRRSKKLKTSELRELTAEELAYEEK